MATSTETSERDDTERSSTTAESTNEGTEQGGLRARAMTQVKNGRLPMAVGAIMTVRGVRGMLSNEGRGLAQTVVGLGLLGFGLRRRSQDESSMIDIPLGDDDRTDEEVPGSETVALRAQSNQPGQNPRDVDDEPDVATAGDDEGDVHFETERGDVDVERKPHLDEVDPKDPRYPDEDDPEAEDEHVDVDISEPALADEPNEAVGPDESQAYPASEGTDPEPSAAQSPEQAEGEVTDEEGEEATTDPDFEELSDESHEDESNAADSDDAESGDFDEEGTGDEDVNETEASDEDADEDEES